MKKIIRRALTVIPIAALQAFWILLLMKWLEPYTALVSLALSVAAFLFVPYLILKRDERQSPSRGRCSMRSLATSAWGGRLPSGFAA